ncbi:hypothetical protein BDV98DRAFT_577119, partial [Pterulicium gracile]
MPNQEHPVQSCDSNLVHAARCPAAFLEYATPGFQNEACRTKVVGLTLHPAISSFVLGILRFRFRALGTLCLTSAITRTVSGISPSGGEWCSSRWYLAASPSTGKLKALTLAGISSSGRCHPIWWYLTSRISFGSPIALY